MAVGAPAFQGVCLRTSVVAAGPCVGRAARLGRATLGPCEVVGRPAADRFGDGGTGLDDEHLLSPALADRNGVRTSYNRNRLWSRPGGDLDPLDAFFVG